MQGWTGHVSPIWKSAIDFTLSARTVDGAGMDRLPMQANSLASAQPANRQMFEVWLYGGLFAVAVASFCLERLVAAPGGLAAQVLAVSGDATCGWSWLLARALFQKPSSRRQYWPLALVLALVVAGAVLRVSGDAAAALPRMVANVGTLISSTLLLMAAFEPIRGISRETPKAERRFRAVFACGYVAILAVAVIWINGSPNGSFAALWGGSIKAACAVLALLGMALAIWYRRRNPQVAGRETRPRVPGAGESALGQRLLGLMRDDAAYALPDLRVADVARRVGEAEYRVTQCITGSLGFRNFNHMTNHFRVSEAKRRLADARFSHLPILTIALDCGFGSIGPFNRAFKAETGVTPMGFRQARHASAEKN